MTLREALQLGCVGLLFVNVPPVTSQMATVTEIQPNISWGGRAVAVTVSSSDSNIVVAASFSGGLFRSVNGGQSWTHIDSFPANRLWDVRFNPVNGNELVATVLNDSHTVSAIGVWMSRDGGNTWAQAQLPACANPPFGRQISFGPAPNIFVGTDCGLAASGDDGATWRFAISSTSVRTVVSQPGPNFPSDPGSVIVDVCDGSGTPQHSTNNGATFTALALPGNGCVSIGESPIETNVLLAATSVVELWESDDTGASWQKITNVGQGSRYPWLRTGPKYSGPGFQVYLHNGSDMTLLNCTGPQTSSRCAPPTAFATFPYGAHHDFGGVAVPPSACRLFTASDGGIELSLGCAGPPWAETNHGFDALQIYRIAGTVHPDHTDLYIAMQDDGIWASPDGGVSWENPILFDGYIVEAPHSSTGPGQPVTGINGTPWATFTASADLVNPTPFQLPPNSGQYPDFYLLGGGNQETARYLHTDDGCDPPNANPCFLYVTDTNGNWVKQLPALPFKLSGMSRREYIAGPPANPTIYVTTNKIAADGSWFDGLSKITGINQPTITIQPSDVGLGALANWGPDDSPAVIPRIVGVDPSNPQHLIAADASINKMVVSTTGGASWTPDDQLTNLVIDNGNLQFNSPNIGCQAHAIAFDPSNGQRIFIGTEASGIIASLDGGQSWFRVPGTRQIAAASDFFFDEVRGVLYVASYGRGLWTITGLTAPPVIQITNLVNQRSRWCATITATESGQPVSGTVVIHGSSGMTGQQICFAPCTSQETVCNPERKPPCTVINIPISCSGSVTIGSETIPILVGPPR
jgi:photosystem II stability/assembly factor-like uncharacterized protein